MHIFHVNWFNFGFIVCVYPFDDSSCHSIQASIFHISHYMLCCVNENYGFAWNIYVNAPVLWISRHSCCPFITIKFSIFQTQLKLKFLCRVSCVNKSTYVLFFKFAKCQIVTTTNRPLAIRQRLMMICFYYYYHQITIFYVFIAIQ